MSAVCAAGAGLVHSSSSENGLPSLNERVLSQTALQETGFLMDRTLTRLRKMRHGILTAARLQGEGFVRRGARYKPAMATLTYDTNGQRGTFGGTEWRPRHLSEYLDRVRKWAKKRGVKTLSYAWVAEMQERGVIHYHVMYWLPYVPHTNRKGHVSMRPFKLPKPDSVDDAQGVHVPHWPNGHSEIAWARKAAGYLAKYTSKGQDVGDPPFPKGVRISGVGGLDAPGRLEFRWWRAPSEAREFFGPGVDIRRVKGGRVDKDTGNFWESPWLLFLIQGKPTLLKKGNVLCA